jgi:hypothetical protein
MYPKIVTETTEFVKEYYKIRLPGYVTKSGRRRPLTSTGFKRVGLVEVLFSFLQPKYDDK